MNTKKNREKLSSEELAEAYVFPHGLTKAEKEKEDAAFLEMRKQRLREQTEREKLLARLLQLKYELQDYLENDRFDPKRNFSWFLNEYVKIIDRKKKELAHDLFIHVTQLSQVITNKVEPSEKMMIRLEIHSNGIIPAVYWYKLAKMKREHELSADTRLRKEEKKFVRNKLNVSI